MADELKEAINQRRTACAVGGVITSIMVGVAIGLIWRPAGGVLVVGAVHLLDVIVESYCNRRFENAYLRSKGPQP